MTGHEFIVFDESSDIDPAAWERVRRLVGNISRATASVVVDGYWAERLKARLEALARIDSALRDMIADIPPIMAPAASGDTLGVVPLRRGASRCPAPCSCPRQARPAHGGKTDYG